MFNIEFVLSGTVMLNSRWCCLPRVGEFIEFNNCRFIIKSITYRVMAFDTVAVAELDWT